MLYSPNPMGQYNAVEFVFFRTLQTRLNQLIESMASGHAPYPVAFVFDMSFLDVNLLKAKLKVLFRLKIQNILFFIMPS